MFSVFVSYAHEQLDWATHLRGLLNAPAVQVYVAEHDLPAGESLSRDISSQIKACDLFVLLWTEDAERSQYVGKEVFLARAESKQIIPLLLQPGIVLPSELGDMKYVDIQQDPTAQFQWLQQKVQGLAHRKEVGSFVAMALIGFGAWVLLRGDG